MKKGYFWPGLFYLFLILFIVAIFFFLVHGGIFFIKVTAWFSFFTFLIWLIFLILFYQYVFNSTFTGHFILLIFIIFMLLTFGIGMPYGGFIIIF